MLSGAHIVIFSRNAEADRAFVRDVLGLPTLVTDQSWGLATHITLPSGARLGIYQPRHPHLPRS